MPTSGLPSHVPPVDMDPTVAPTALLSRYITNDITAERIESPTVAEVASYRRSRSESTSSDPPTRSMIVEIFSVSLACVLTRISSTAWAVRYVSVRTR